MTDEEYAILKTVALDITKGCNTQYEKIKAIVSYVANTIYYDYVYYYGISPEVYTNPYDIYINKRTVCSGYAGFVRTLCIANGIPCANLVGEDHEFNVIYDSDNDKWIFEDATWCSWNTYTENKEWKYNGYSFSFFDLGPEELAELSIVGKICNSKSDADRSKF